MTIINNSNPNAKFNKQFISTGILKLSPALDRMDYGVRRREV